MRILFKFTYGSSSPSSNPWHIGGLLKSELNKWIKLCSLGLWGLESFLYHSSLSKGDTIASLLLYSCIKHTNRQKWDHFFIHTGTSSRLTEAGSGYYQSWGRKNPELGGPQFSSLCCKWCDRFRLGTWGRKLQDCKRCMLTGGARQCMVPTVRWDPGWFPLYSGRRTLEGTQCAIYDSSLCPISLTLSLP